MLIRGLDNQVTQLCCIAYVSVVFQGAQTPVRYQVGMTSGCAGFGDRISHILEGSVQLGDISPIQSMRCPDMSNLHVGMPGCWSHLRNWVICSGMCKKRMVSMGSWHITAMVWISRSKALLKLPCLSGEGVLSLKQPIARELTVKSRGSSAC